MTIKALYQGKTVEVEIDEATMYKVFHEQQRRFFINDILERVGEYFDNSGVNSKAVDAYLKGLEADTEKVREIIELYEYQETEDDAFCGRQANRDEALKDVRADIEEKFNIEVCL